MVTTAATAAAGANFSRARNARTAATAGTIPRNTMCAEMAMTTYTAATMMAVKERLLLCQNERWAVGNDWYEPGNGWDGDE
jgi:hypothetical protein